MSVKPCAFQSPNVKLPTLMPPFDSICVFSFTTPSESAAHAIIGFQVEPGGYSPETARLKSGLSGSSMSV